MCGPSGKIVQSKFVFDEIRNRFVYPQDSSLIVYFEWEASAGTHVLTAFWKGPDGITATISPDLRMETTTSTLNAYWVYQIVPTMAGGVWTLEVHIDGEPAGSQSFEVAIPPLPKTTGDESGASPKAPNLDQIYKSAMRSMVWIHKLDETGRRTDTASGFVIGSNNIATAFQAIDSSPHLEIEFANGRKVQTEQVWLCNRLQDWALIKADTRDTVPMTRGDYSTVAVGERLIVFNVETGLARVIGGVDIGAKRTVAGFGERIQMSPSLTPEAMGGPLMDSFGKVVGILGGSLTPGVRFKRRDMSLSPGLWTSLDLRNTASPIGVLPEQLPTEPVTLTNLSNQGTLTPPITATPNFVYGGTTSTLLKRTDGSSPADTSEFSRKDPNVWVYTLWEKRDKAGKGALSARVYDARNQLRVTTDVKKVNLPTGPPERIAFSFPPSQFQPGIYRVDVLWNDRPAWRTFFQIVD